MDLRQWKPLIIGTILCLFSAGNGMSQEADSLLTGHAFYGQMVISNNNSDLEGNDLYINIFGADVQKAFGEGPFKYGFETGAYFSFDSDVRRFYASSGSGGGTVAVSVDVNSFMIDYFFGGCLAFEPSKWFRLNAGVGPLLIWASRETEPEASAPEEITSQYESGFGAGLYARAGIDIFFTDEFGLNLGLRINGTTLNLKDSTGEIDIEGLQYYLGVAFHF